ncbi:uncharacterized protein ARB_07508 [Trichophyton benhamiae CBS 112371]|uniref:NmrA-like domain-containing protein n=1 Tax=Arthroderma benhamiae (strain ATCC MYA-4681 / CBS 112371) TaxID=663331 RepID=D4ATE4_ARTBC|nr:uncharacterized protein ARB_07508 [Trichophyton benhamiae CBS 112371]EFE33563.1 hypothetical protein ARB_07508 [Trichophyton benhamiae CBS 112371]
MSSTEDEDERNRRSIYQLSRNDKDKPSSDSPDIATLSTGPRLWWTILLSTGVKWFIDQGHHAEVPRRAERLKPQGRPPNIGSRASSTSHPAQEHTGCLHYPDWISNYKGAGRTSGANGNGGKGGTFANVGIVTRSSLGARQGCTVIVPYREEMTKRHLKVTGDLGRVVFMVCMRNTPIGIYYLLNDSNRNMTSATPNRSRRANFSYEDIHVEGTERIVESVAKYDVDRYVHVSSYNASLDSPSEFFRTKAQGENVARSIFPETTIVRPAPMFGFEDRLLHRLAGVTNIFTSNHMQERYWPVHAIDVGRALEIMLMEEWTTAQTFELYGPKNYSTKEISELVDREIIKKRRHINVPKAIMKPAAYWLNRLLWWPITSADEVEREFIDQQIDPTAKTFKDLGIEPTDLNTLTFHYLVCTLKPSVLLEILTNFSITAWIQKLPVRRSTASYRAGAQGGEKIPPCSGLSINWYYTIVLLAFLDLVCMYTQCLSDALKFLYLVPCTFQLVHARVTNGTPLVDYGFQVPTFFPKCSSPSRLRTSQWSQAIHYKYGPNSKEQHHQGFRLYRQPASSTYI